MAASFVSPPGVFRTSYAQSNNLTQVTLGFGVCGIDIPPTVINLPFGLHITIPGVTHTIDGWWDPILQTCNMLSDYTVPLGTDLVIPSGRHLVVDHHALQNNGQIDNYGTIRAGVIFGGTINNGGSIINDGQSSKIDVSGSSNLENSGTMNNSGTISTNLGAGIYNSGHINNANTLTCLGAHIEDQQGGSILNRGSGTISIKGCPFDVQGSLVNDPNGQITNLLGEINSDGGAFNNSGDVTIGALTTKAAPGTKGLFILPVPTISSISNYNGGILHNNGTISILFASNLNNGCHETVSDVLNSLNPSTDAIQSCASIEGAGTIINNGTINTVGGNFINNNGHIANGPDGIINIEPWEYLFGTKLSSLPSFFVNGPNSSNSASPAERGGDFDLGRGNYSPLGGYQSDETCCQVTNNGTIYVHSSTTFVSSGNFTNNGNIEFDQTSFSESAFCSSYYGGVILTCDPQTYGGFVNNGLLENNANLYNFGNFTTTCGGTILQEPGSIFNSTADYYNGTATSFFGGPAGYVLLHQLTNFYNDSSSLCTPQDTSVHALSTSTIVPTNLTSISTTTTTTTTTTTSMSSVCDSSTTSSCTTSATVEGGSVDVNQIPSTGVYIQISAPSASNGTSVTVTSSDLNGKPSWTANIPLAGESFYDVNVSQSPSLGSDAVATICINVTSQVSTMEYWNGTSWENAYDYSMSGNTVCGTVPVSALSGTPIVIGSPVSGPPPAMVDGNVTIYATTHNHGEILFTANATIYEMHSSPFTESALPQYGTLPNGTYGYLGYYRGTFAAVSGGQKGANVTISVEYDGVSETGSAISPGVGNTTSVNFVFNSTEYSEPASVSQSLFEYNGILSPFLPATVFMAATGNFGEPLSRLESVSQQHFLCSFLSWSETLPYRVR